MPKNKKFQRPFTNRSYYNATHVPQSELINFKNRELGIRCKQCTRILTYYHPKSGDLCPICRKLGRNSKIRRIKRQDRASQLESSIKTPTDISHIRKRHGNIFQANASQPERFSITEVSEQTIDASSLYSVEDDPNYFSFESSDRNDNFKFDNDLQIFSHSNQVNRSVQLKQKNQQNSPFQQPILNKVKTIVNSATTSHMRGIKRKEVFENVSLKRLRPDLVDSPVLIDYELTRSMCHYYAENAQTDEVFYAKMELRNRLENIVQERFPGSELFVFGSSMTGYGSKTCDVDVCLMFHDLQIKKKRAVTILWELKRLLSRKYFFIKLQVIQARVPILKFKDTYSGFDVDLNINHPTGIRNSQLLRSYARIDDRVRPLILAIKLWARSHDINDARTGSLSSYCLGLMLIHYLQCIIFGVVVAAVMIVVVLVGLYLYGQMRRNNKPEIPSRLIEPPSPPPRPPPRVKENSFKTAFKGFLNRENSDSDKQALKESWKTQSLPSNQAQSDNASPKKALSYGETFPGENENEAVIEVEVLAPDHSKVKGTYPSVPEEPENAAFEEVALEMEGEESANDSSAKSPGPDYAAVDYEKERQSRVLKEQESMESSTSAAASPLPDDESDARLASHSSTPPKRISESEGIEEEEEEEETEESEESKKLNVTDTEDSQKDSYEKMKEELKKQEEEEKKAKEEMEQKLKEERKKEEEKKKESDAPVPGSRRRRIRDEPAPPAADEKPVLRRLRRFQ